MTTSPTDGPSGAGEGTTASPIEPRLGQRVRFTGSHRFVETGRTGFIELIRGDRFWVMTDCGGWFGWTSFASWEPTGEPDVELSEEFKAMRTGATP